MQAPKTWTEEDICTLETPLNTSLQEFANAYRKHDTKEHNVYAINMNACSYSHLH